MKTNVFVLGSAVIISLGMASCSRTSGNEPRGASPIPVATYEVREGKASYYDEYPATVTALNQVDIRPEVSGYITEISFKDGQRVAAGMKLYTIDQQRYHAAYDQALANLNVAKSNLAKARQDADRYAELAKKDAVARQTLEHSQADLESATMQVAAAEANVKDVQTNLLYSVITAPFSGTIGISSVKLGSSVTAGQTLLNTISSDDPMAVDCAVDEKQIGRFTQMLQEKNQDSTFTIVLPDQTLYPYTGRLSFMDRAVDSQTGTIRIRVIFPNPKRLLRAGLTCNLRVRANGATESLLVPSKSVVEQMGEYFVFVVDSTRVSQRRVDLGMRINDKVIVKSGLRPGNQIAMDGVQKLRDQSLVSVIPAAAQSR